MAVVMVNQDLFAAVSLTTRGVIAATRDTRQQQDTRSLAGDDDAHSHSLACIILADLLSASLRRRCGKAAGERERKRVYFNKIEFAKKR